MGPIRVAILDDHPVVADGYRYRLMKDTDIAVVCVLYFGEDLIPALCSHEVDILLLDMQVITSRTNETLYNTLHLVPEIHDRFPNVAILVISQFQQRAMISSMLNAGADGYILKDDHEAYDDLPGLVRVIAKGGMYLSARVRESLMSSDIYDPAPRLSPRQLEAISLCANYPNERIPELAQRMNMAASSLRVLLWDSYHRLGVNSRTAAMARARQIGILPPEGMHPTR